MNYEELVKALRCKRDDCEGCDLAFFDKDEGWMCRYSAKGDDAAAAIEDLQAQLPKRGEWKTTRPDAPMFGFYYCSICGRRRTSPQDNYCPNCGADMRAKMEVQE